MKWVAISGSRKTDDRVRKGVRRIIKEIYDNGDGIVTGGALGVDYFATDELLCLDPTASRLKVYLPVTLDRYARHYRHRADEGVITHEEAEKLVSQLEKVQKANREALIENPRATAVNELTYFERNTAVLNATQELIAFQVNNSPGTKDTMEKAEHRGMPVTKYTYTIP